MLQTAFGPPSMNRASIFEWHKRFMEDREFVRDDERSGWSKEVRTLELIEFVRDDERSGWSKEVRTLELIGQRVRVRVTMLRF